MKETIKERKKYARVIAKAWVDEDFKNRLLDDPASTLKENGIEIPQGITIRFVEENKNEILIPLPPRPQNSSELSIEELEKVAGAGASGIESGESLGASRSNPN